jgi:ABC-type multidrug transport system fused ATPase/permease subunit
VSVWQTVKSALGLLSGRDRRLLVLSVLLQMATSALDVLGVLLTGIVGALGVTAVQSEPPPEPIKVLSDTLGLSEYDSTTQVAIFAGAAAVALLLKTLISGLLTRRILVFLANRQAIVSARLTKALLSRPITFVQRRSSQETAYALIQGAGAATMQVLGQSAIAVTEATMLIALSITLFLLDPWITLGAVLFFAVLAWSLQRTLGRWAHRLGSAAAAADIGSLNAIQEALSAYREVTVTNRRQNYVDRIQALRWDAARVTADSQLMGLIPKWLFESALVVGGFVLAAILFTTKDASAAVGTLTLFLAAASRVMPSLLRLQGATLSLRGIAGTAAPTFVLAQELDHPMDSESPHVNVEEIRKSLTEGYPDFSPSVVVRNLDFRYPGSTQPALRDINLALMPGRSLAIAGSSGAGKTTLADVILGVLPVDSGEVLLGGIHPAEAVSRWPGAVAYVPQVVSLSNGSVRKNVALGLPEDSIDDDLVWEALERAHLAEYLRTSRDGLDTYIGEGGVHLSGGQRQRLGIARALFSRPRFLVLDEATSALDAETEVAITETIRELENEVTTVVIAHRLSTIQSASAVAYIECGRIVALGTFDEVRRLAPPLDRQAQLLGIP